MTRGIWEFETLRDDGTGDAVVVTGATVTVKKESDGTLANIYDAVTGGSALANPFNPTGSTILFYADQEERYRITIETATLTRDLRHQSVSIALADYTPTADSLLPVDGLTALQALTGPVDGEHAYLTYRDSEGDGAHGVFRWDASDLSTEVAADTQSGIYVPPNSDNTGASGAWVRLYTGKMIDTAWFGALPSGTDAANTTAINAALDAFGAEYAFVINRGVAYTWASLTPTAGQAIFDYSKNGGNGAFPSDALFIYRHLAVDGDINLTNSTGNPEITFSGEEGYDSDRALFYHNESVKAFGLKYSKGDGSLADLFLFDTLTNDPKPRWRLDPRVDKGSGNPGYYWTENGSDRMLLEYTIADNAVTMKVRNAADNGWVTVMQWSGEDNNPAVIYPEVSSKPSAPSGGFKIYARDAGTGVKLYKQDSGGTETEI